LTVVFRLSETSFLRDPIRDLLNARRQQRNCRKLALAVDEIAERIRTTGARAPGSYSEYIKLSAVTEDTGSPSALEMIKVLVNDQQSIVEVAKRVVAAAEDAGDLATADLGTRRIDIHEKNAWMLRSHLE